MNGKLRALAAMAALVACGAAFAQESTSFRIKQAAFNAGGRPLDGEASSSASFLIRPDAIGEGIVSLSSASASFRISAGIIMAFAPPGEVDNLVFADQTTLAWDAEPFAMHYHVYRAGPLGKSTGVMPVGDCLPPDVAGLTTTETAVPALNGAFFYFVNAVNCTATEGPAGTNGVKCQ